MAPRPEDFLPVSALTSARREAQQGDDRELDAFLAEDTEDFPTAIGIEFDRIGIPPRLRSAKVDEVPREIATMNSMGLFPTLPFGLVGPPGCGKSCALSAKIRENLVADKRKFGPNKWRVENMAGVGLERGIVTAKPVLISWEPHYRFRWIGWPAYSVRMKRLAANREWTNPEASLETVIEWIKADPKRNIAIIDDLGMERIKGEKGYVQEQLELLVDEAFNADAKLFWNSNHSVEELQREANYGQRFMSRLCSMSPDKELPKNMPDLRVVG